MEKGFLSMHLVLARFKLIVRLRSGVGTAIYLTCVGLQVGNVLEDVAVVVVNYYVVHCRPCWLVNGTCLSMFIVIGVATIGISIALRRRMIRV